MKYKINSDCIYLPAQKPPKSCQDYAICSEYNDPDPFLIICDGCGSSKNTDIGARLIAHCAKSYFQIMSKVNGIFEYKEFGLASVVTAFSASSILKVNEQALDSTLIFSYVQPVKHNDETFITTFMYGDGYVFSTGKDGNLNYYKKVSYKGNAPHYLSYKLNEKRYDKYKSDINQAHIDSKILDLNHVENRDVPIYEQIISGVNISRTQTLIISSDGIESFVDISTGEKIDFMEIINEICMFKTRKGEFVKRRVRRMLDDLAKKGIYNYDDISIAAFTIEDDE